MSPRTAGRAVRRRWRWFVLPLVVALGLSAMVSLLTAPVYRSSASVYFSLQNGSTASDLVQGSTYAQGQVASFAALASTPVVLQPVIDELGLTVSPTQLAQRVTAGAPVDTVLVDVAVLASTAAEARRVTDAVAQELASTVERLAPRNADGQTTVQAEIVTPASLQSTPVSPDLRVDLVVGLLVGLLLGLAAALARDVLDNRVRDSEVLSAMTTLPLVGTVAEDDDGGGRRVVVEVAPHDPRSEFFRQLRTNLQFLDVPSEAGGDRRRLQVVLVTSALPGEGKSTVAANLAAALAETEPDVLLIDADMRRPSQSAVLGLEGGVGLSTVLLGRVELADVVQEWGRSGLNVLPSGAVPPNPGELLASPAMRKVLGAARDRYSYVVIDSPPVLPVADAAIMSKLVDGVLVVASAKKLRRPQLQEALASLEQVGARTLGVALNRVHRDTDAYSYQSAVAPEARTTWAGSPPGRAEEVAAADEASGVRAAAAQGSPPHPVSNGADAVDAAADSSPTLVSLPREVVGTVREKPVVSGFEELVASEPHTSSATVADAPVASADEEPATSPSEPFKPGPGGRRKGPDRRSGASRPRLDRGGRRVTGL